MIKKLLGALALSLTCTVSIAAESGHPLETAPDRLNDMASLQNGAKLFVNYCLSCHSANSMRYNKLTEIGLSDDEIKKNLLFTGDKVGDLMQIAMTPDDAKKWFGTAPPDLSVIARAKSINLGPTGVDYIYTFLRSYYRDTSKLSGWDNLAFPNVAMPNVLWQRQGERTLNRAVIHQVNNEDGTKSWERVATTFDPQGYSEVKKDKLENYTGNPSVRNVFESSSPAAAAAFDNEVADLSNFLGWMAEPVQLKRKQMGVWVLLFLSLFLVVAWRLNSVYWKDVK